MEIVVLLLGLSVVFGGLVQIYRRGLTSRRFNVDPALPAPEPRTRITMGVYQPALETLSRVDPEIQAEISQTMEWWDSEFFSLLDSSSLTKLP